MDLGQVLINERVVDGVVRQLGRDQRFTWDCNPRVSVKPETATVSKGERLVCELTYAPSAAETLNNYKVTCGIINGRKYNLHLNAVGHRPALKFSFHRSLARRSSIRRVCRPHADPHRQQRGRETVPIDCLFDSAAMPFPSQRLAHYARPRSLGGHDCFVHAEGIEGLPRCYSVPDQRVVHRQRRRPGEGVPLRLDLANPAQTSVNFGSLRGGQSSTREVKLVNRSRLPVS